LRGSKGPIEERDPAKLYARACALGWPSACVAIDGTPGDAASSG
jgi:hypothetical protein